MPQKKIMEVVSSNRKMTNRAIKKVAKGDWSFHRNSSGNRVGYVAKDVKTDKRSHENATFISNRALRLTNAKRLMGENEIQARRRTK